MTRSDGSERLHSQRARRAAADDHPATAGRAAEQPASRPRRGSRAAGSCGRPRRVGRGARGAVQLHWPAAFRAAYYVVHDSAAAEDIAQEAFLAAVRALDRFDARRPFAPWINRIVVNRAIDHSRSRALRREVGAELAESAEAPAAGRGISDELLAALAVLGPEQRAVVVLRYLLDWTPGEIARALGIPRGTVNSRLRRALDRLGELGGGGEVNERELRRALRERPGAGRARGGRAHAARPARRPGGGCSPAAAPSAAPAGGRGRAACRAGAAGHGVQPGGGRRAPLDRRSPRPGALADALAPARGGRLLVSSPDGHLGRRGGRLAAAARRLHRARAGRRAASTSVAARGRRLYAVEPDGTVRWSIVRPEAGRPSRLVAR